MPSVRPWAMPGLLGPSVERGPSGCGRPPRGDPGRPRLRTRRGGGVRLHPSPGAGPGRLRYPSFAGPPRAGRRHDPTRGPSPADGGGLVVVRSTGSPAPASPGVRIDLEVPAIARRPLSGTSVAIAGRAGITVAYWLCAHLDRTISSRRQAIELGVAPSRRSPGSPRPSLAPGSSTGTVGRSCPSCSGSWWTSGREIGTGSWASPTPQAAGPDAPPWRRTGTAAAAAYGAPVVTAGEGSGGALCRWPRSSFPSPPGAMARPSRAPVRPPWPWPRPSCPSSARRRKGAHGGSGRLRALLAVALDLPRTEAGTRDPSRLGDRRWRLALNRSYFSQGPDGRVGRRHRGAGEGRLAPLRRGRRGGRHRPPRRGAHRAYRRRRHRRRRARSTRDRPGPVGVARRQPPPRWGGPPGAHRDTPRWKSFQWVRWI